MSSKIFAYRTTFPSQNSVLFPGALLFLAVVVAGCTTSAPPPPPQPVENLPEVVVPEVVQDVVPEAAVTNQLLRFEVKGVAFLEAPKRASERRDAESKKMVQAEGFGLPSPASENSAQKRLTAMEAAQYRALANLAEKRTGIEVTREARTIDMAFAGEEICVNLSSTLSGVSEVSRSYDEATEIATVTLQVALETKEDPEHTAFEQALSVEHRKVRAVAAARMQATASMREQIGQIYVEQDILVEDFILTHQEVRTYVQGLLENIHFSEARWLSEISCEVTASLELDKAELDRMAEGPPDGPSEQKDESKEP